jgi:Putative transposase DNA-binding domain
MGQTARTTKLLLDLSEREQGGANRDKRRYLEETVAVLDAARRFYLNFFLAHPQKLMERVEVISKQSGEVSERLLSADKLLTWAEVHTVATAEHPDPLPQWNFSQAFPDFPTRYRRSVIKDCIGKARGYLTTLHAWQHAGKKKGKPGVPTAANHPTLDAGTYALDLDELDLRKSFVRLKVSTGSQWVWVHSPTRYNRYFELRRGEEGWEQESPKLILSKQTAALHFLQSKPITAAKIVESKRNPDLVTVAVDLNVKQLAVITVRQHGTIIQTRFVSDQGLDQHRFRHAKRVAKKQWQSGTPVKGERSNQQLWLHIRRQNTDVAHKTARAIVQVCAAGYALAGDQSKGRQQVEKTQPQASQPTQRQKQSTRQRESVCIRCGERRSQSHGTSQYCSRCGSKGVRFTSQAGQHVPGKGGKLFFCPVCHYECHADFNASCNVHHSFWREFHWQPRLKRSG